MTNESEKDRSFERDPDLVNSEVALRRAAIRARDQARHSAGYVVVFREGKIVKEWLDKRVA